MARQLTVLLDGLQEHEEARTAQVQATVWIRQRVGLGPIPPKQAGYLARVSARNAEYSLALYILDSALQQSPDHKGMITQRGEVLQALVEHQENWREP